MFDPLDTIISALPVLLGVIFLIGLLPFSSAWLIHAEGAIKDKLTFWLTFLSASLLFIPLVFILLRIIVYFRDGCRATTFGILDLVAVIQQIDKKLNKKLDNSDDERLKRDVYDGKTRVRLSFIGHSIYLFSNEADEVLRFISTTVNYFSLPTRSNKFGYRLGNTCLPGAPPGISKGIQWCDLKGGSMTISEICQKLGIRRPTDLRSPS
jgi:hypothetical protein